jgi:archaellin
MSDDPLSVACRHLANSQTIIERKNAEIAQLKEVIQRLANQDATLSVSNGDVTVTMDATLTDDEIDAIKWAIEVSAGLSPGEVNKTSVTLHNLLERTK